MIIAQHFSAGDSVGNKRMSPVGTTKQNLSSVVPTGLMLFYHIGSQH
jgi:hypothetical protein